MVTLAHNGPTTMRARRAQVAAAALMLLAATLGGCGFAQTFCGDTPGNCQAEVVDVRFAAVESGVPLVL